MEITLTATIPDDVAANLQNGSTTPLPRLILELAAIKAHEEDTLTERGVMDMLGFSERDELYEFFKKHDVRGASYTSEDAEDLQELLRTHNK